MSCYGWERGEVKLPAGEFSKFKKELVAKMKDKEVQLFEKAIKIHDTLKAKKPSERVAQLFQEMRGLNCHESFNLERVLFNKEKKLVKPKKNDFKGCFCDSETLKFYDTDLTVKLDAKNKLVIYTSDDNNHAVDDARESFLGSTIFRMLENVKFTTQTGGVFRSRTEYDCQESAAGVTKTFGKYKNPKYSKELYGF